MGWAEAIAWIFKLIGTVLDMRAKGLLTQDKLDAAVRSLEYVPPPKE
jgi:hypothetical protein